MSLLIPILGLGAATVVAASSMQKRAAAAQLTADPQVEEKRPIEGRYQPYSSVAQNNSLTLADVKRVTKTTDVRGMPVFLVDYVGGARVLQYFDPRELGQI